MGLMLDTSAVIGWLELQNADLVRYLLEHAGDAAPAIHAVTLGELERGVIEAGDEATRARRGATLRFSREELTAVPLTATGEQAHLFGVVSAAVSRRASHNDCWIAAAALEVDDTLVTMDEQLTDLLRAAAQGDCRLAEWLAARGRTLDVAYLSR